MAAAAGRLRAFCLHVNPTLGGASLHVSVLGVLFAASNQSATCVGPLNRQPRSRRHRLTPFVSACACCTGGACSAGSSLPAPGLPRRGSHHQKCWWREHRCVCARAFDGYGLSLECCAGKAARLPPLPAGCLRVLCVLASVLRAWMMIASKCLACQCVLSCECCACGWRRWVVLCWGTPRGCLTCSVFAPEGGVTHFARQV